MKKEKRQKILIEGSLQLRYLAMTVILMVIMAISIAWIIYFTTWSSLLDELEGIAHLDQLIIDLGRLMLIRTAAVGLGCILVAAFITTLVFHRIVGPLFRLKKIMDRLGEGVVPSASEFRIRRKDELKSLASSTETALRKIHATAAENKNLLEKANLSIDGAVHSLNQDNPELNKIRNELADLKNILQKLQLFRHES